MKKFFATLGASALVLSQLAGAANADPAAIADAVSRGVCGDTPAQSQQNIVDAEYLADGRLKVTCNRAAASAEAGAGAGGGANAGALVAGGLGGSAAGGLLLGVLVLAAAGGGGGGGSSTTSSTTTSSTTTSTTTTN